MTSPHTPIIELHVSFTWYYTRNRRDCLRWETLSPSHTQTCSSSCVVVLFFLFFLLPTLTVTIHPSRQSSSAPTGSTTPWPRPSSTHLREASAVFSTTSLVRPLSDAGGRMSSRDAALILLMSPPQEPTILWPWVCSPWPTSSWRAGPTAWPCPPGSSSRRC